MASIEKLSLYLLNVGKGDSVLIDFPDGSFGIIDTGPSKKDDGLLALLDERKGRLFRFAAITHWDADHAAGMSLILSKYRPVRRPVHITSPLCFGLDDIVPLATRRYGVANFDRTPKVL